MAKGKRVCDQCGNKLATPRKLRDHLKRKFKCKPKPIQILVQLSTTQDKDQDPKAGPAPVTQDQDPEAGPGPATQTYREEQTIIQSNINQKKYASENYFRSIYKVEDGIIEKEPPSKNIEFLERRPDPNKGHQNLNSMMVWEAILIRSDIGCK